MDALHHGGIFDRGAWLVSGYMWIWECLWLVAGSYETVPFEKEKEKKKNSKIGRAG